MRMPACRRPLAFSIAAGALAFCTPALAQPEMAAEGRVIYHNEPVVQPLPGQPAPPPPPEDYYTDEPQPPLPPPPPITEYHHPMAAPPMGYVPGYAGAYTPPPGYGSPYSPNGFGYGGGYALVPVMVAIPQRQIVRETVTEEWVDVPARSRTIERPPQRPAPGAHKRTKYSK